MTLSTFSRVRLFALVPALALVLGACGDDKAAPPVPQLLAKTAGDGVTAEVATATPAAPTLKVTDQNGRVVRGVVVNFAVTAGGGSLGATVDTTDASGVATAMTWTLGTTSGVQTVTASTPSIAGITATFTATALAGAPATLVFITQPPLTARAGEPFQGPVIEIRDRFGNRTSSTATVTLGVASNDGSATLTGVTTVVAVDGRATFGMLTTGSSGVLTLVASLTGLAPALSNSFAVASGVAAALVKLSGDVQLGDAGTNAFLPPTVRVTDAFGNAVSGAIVTFSVVSGGGSIVGAVATTDANGIARLTRWDLGPAAGDNVVRATVDNITVTFTATALAPTPFHIELRYINTPTRRQQDAFESAWRKWRNVITGDIPNFSFVGNSLCGRSASNEVFEDIVIYVQLSPIDGPGQVLGSAGPCAANPANLLPFVGNMTFDTADLTSLETSGQLDQVIVHEMGHVLGIGTLWSFKGQLVGAGTDSSSYNGAAAMAVWHSLGGPAGTRVPVENCVGLTNCGAGTRDGHWRERTFRTELMTGFLNAGVANPLSALTIASLQDLGYTVNMGAAEPYALPAALMAGEATSGGPAGTGAALRLIEAPPTWKLLIPDGRGGSLTPEEWRARYGKQAVEAK